jgi:hypothetical protein|tara:strand:- start:498 stop:743 length:246 start_codon:yes stop_codon:yes gene_type:complete
MQAFQFMKKYQEQLPGFKYVVNEIFQKQIFTAKNHSLASLLTLDFEEYIETCERAQNHFFEDACHQSPPNNTDNLRKKRSS